MAEPGGAQAGVGRLLPQRQRVDARQVLARCAAVAATEEIAERRARAARVAQARQHRMDVAEAAAAFTFLPQWRGAHAFEAQAATAVCALAEGLHLEWPQGPDRGIVRD